MEKMNEQVEIKQEEKDGVCILQLKGRLDAITSPGVERKVFEIIEKGQNKLLLDFSHVDYLSSAGMRVLLSILKKLRSAGGKLIVCSVTLNVMDVLKMSGFDRVLEISSSEGEALQLFSSL